MASLVVRLGEEMLRFPGMLPREIVVWVEWLKAHAGEYDRFEYNTRVGTGLDPGPSYPPEIRQQAILNSQKRIDAVGYKITQITLFEVKDRAGLSAVGQLLGYRVLWLRAAPQGPTPLLRLLCATCSPDMWDVATATGIWMELVKADFSILRPTGKPF